MCGIVACCGVHTERHIFKSMLQAIAHRGPDDSGMYQESLHSFGMTRLSIIDIQSGHQPIWSEDKRYCIVFNGELYNCQELREKLQNEGVKFSTRSDTEVVLYEFVVHGYEGINCLQGMFSFVIFDTISKEVCLARDPLGIKPLYYFKNESVLIVASELKAILQHPIIQKKLNHNSVARYLALRYVPGPETMFIGINKFPPGHWMSWTSRKFILHRYWNFPHSAISCTYNEAAEIFENALDTTTKRLMVSERPVGLYLSSGLDSTAIAVSLRKQFGKCLKTFSVGFGCENDELLAASATAKALGYEHFGTICKPEHFELLPDIIRYLDEPLGDAITLPMFLLSRLACQHVAVVQSGEGADEILGGYFTHRVLYFAKLYRAIIPQLLHMKLVIPLVSTIPASWLNIFFDYPGELGSLGKERFIEFMTLLSSNSDESLYYFFISIFVKQNVETMLSKEFYSQVDNNIMPCTSSACNSSSLFRVQFDNWLPDNILMKLDKMTMANSVEGRVPFMDHKFVETVLSLPDRYKINGFSNKKLIRTYLKNNYSAAFLKRKKMPFFVPLEGFLRSKIVSDIFDDLLSKKSIERRGIIRYQYIDEMRKKQSSAGLLFSKQLMVLAVLEMWCREFLDRS